MCRHDGFLFLELCTKFGSNIPYNRREWPTFVPNVRLMTSCELTSGSVFWSLGHLRVVALDLRSKFGENVITQYGGVTKSNVWTGDRESRSSSSVVRTVKRTNWTTATTNYTGCVLHFGEDDRFCFVSEQAMCSDNESGVHSAVETEVLDAATQLRTSSLAVGAAAAAGADHVAVNKRYSLPLRTLSFTSLPLRRNGVFRWCDTTKNFF